MYDNFKNIKICNNLNELFITIILLKKLYEKKLHLCIIFYKQNFNFTDITYSLIIFNIYT